MVIASPQSRERNAKILALARAGKSDREIMAALGVTKNVVIGARHRAGIASNRDAASPTSMNWQDPWPEPQTLLDRMAALHARMDAVLAECGPTAQYRVPDKPKAKAAA